MSSSQSGSPRSNSDLDVEVENCKNALKEKLDSIQTYGGFATEKQYSHYPNPGLQIKDTLIALPLDPAQVTLIRDASRQVSSGRGDEALIDTPVKNAWELDASEFQIANPAWETFIYDTRNDASQSLGMPSVRAQLHKLVLYEPGSFFKQIRDCEKAPGVVATLIICLPSRHKGGEVHVSYAGKDRVFNTSESIFDISAVAWYADVTSEMQPVLEGYQLVLIYDIIQTERCQVGVVNRRVSRGRSRRRSIEEAEDTDGIISASFHKTQDQNLDSAFARLNLHRTPPLRLVYVLDHCYSQESPWIDGLKGRNRAVCYALREACARNGWHLLLCKVARAKTKKVPHINYWDSDGSDSEDGSSGVPLETVALCDGSTFASNEILYMDHVLGRYWYRNHHGLYSKSSRGGRGNPAVADQYRYHDLAVMMVPKSRLHQFLRDDVRLDALCRMIADDLDAHPEDPATRKQNIEFLSDALVQNPDMSPYILGSFWNLKEDDLFRSAVRAGVRSDETTAAAVGVSIVRTIKYTPMEAIDWNKSFGEFVSSHSSLDDLCQSLDLAEVLLLSQNKQTSFQKWRSTTESSIFETRKSFQVCDHDFIIKLAVLRWDDPDWINNTLLTKIRYCASKHLLSKFICSLLQKGRDEELDGAQKIARVLLESGTRKLPLASPVSFGTSLKSFARAGKDAFCQLLDSCLLSGLHEPVNELLRLSLDLLDPATKGEDMPKAEQQHEWIRPDKVLLDVLGILERRAMPPSEPARDFTITMLKDFVLKDLPESPYEPRGCGDCEHCEKLDAFLISENQVKGTFPGDNNVRWHLQQRLPVKLFLCSICEVEKNSTDSDQPQYGPGLKVVKKFREYDMAVMSRILPLRIEYVRVLIGASAYEELLLLRKPSKRSEQENRLKRRAEEDIESPNIKRQEVEA
ncbi:hypothetical protein F5Y07DRAFT_407119 [Xylaria sp. FL0933]|nr:hypothetical protein F5Y07DRAFT_407119 [Xylaria sp. FL0933]